MYCSPEHRWIDSESIPGAQATDLRPAHFGPFLVVLLRSSDGSRRPSLAVRAGFSCSQVFKFFHLVSMALLSINCQFVRDPISFLGAYYHSARGAIGVATTNRPPGSIALSFTRSPELLTRISQVSKGDTTHTACSICKLSFFWYNRSCHCTTQHTCLCSQVIHDLSDGWEIHSPAGNDTSRKKERAIAALSRSHLRSPGRIDPHLRYHALPCAVALCHSCLGSQTRWPDCPGSCCAILSMVMNGASSRAAARYCVLCLPR